ncbi:zinc finger protein VAR3, chloroplastic isoform X2 [Euphorbia lathyris]|uniref:zinc finger protein VAR3, chloroplastic isoform X2 n=1 Tax=Euphorbia lathyris TaxID=212925 RepID=UPI003313D05A
MSVSKFLLSGNFFFRSNTHHTVLFPFPPILSSKPFPFKSLQFHHRYCSSSALNTVTSDYTETLNSPHEEQKQLHPWPEWVSFVDRLKTKGYFPPSTITEDATTGNVYKDMNQLKDPCLSFARDRYDLFKSLSVGDIQDVVNCGCPNLLRKAVNSAKRLRVYLRLDEGDVCSACNLRGSCDRAYVLLKGNEADARTVDIVRILMFYALDPLVISGEQKPPGREVVEVAVRKLLSDLIELSQTTPDPPVQKPAAKAVPKKEQERKYIDGNWPSQSDVSVDGKLSRDVEMKRGDWMCLKCNFMNFSKNIRCLNCKEEGPKKLGDTDTEIKKGDWICSKCDFMNFYRNKRCLKCKEEGPVRAAVGDIEMKKGDWNCSKCGFMNFASNKMCLRCEELRPKRQLSHGEWECPSCDFVNYSRNVSCLKCKHDRPKAPTSEYEESMWRSPH